MKIVKTIFDKLGCHSSLRRHSILVYQSIELIIAKLKRGLKITTVIIKPLKNQEYLNLLHFIT